MFYTFVQNNSGGKFKYDARDGISRFVIVEADSAAAANSKAEEIGLYFDGCDDGRDCSCCGDRWYAASGDGDAEPSIYGGGINEYTPKSRWIPNGCEGFLHPANGKFVALFPVDKPTTK